MRKKIFFFSAAFMVKAQKSNRQMSCPARGYCKLIPKADILPLFSTAIRFILKNCLIIKALFNPWQFPRGTGFYSFMQSVRIPISQSALLAFFIGLMVLGVLATRTPALELSSNEAGNAAAAWHIEADQLTYMEAAELYRARGRVLIRREGTRLTADSVKVNRKTMEALAEGDVTLKTGGDVLSGSKMTFDLDSRTGTVFDGTAFFEKKNFYIRGEKIEKTGVSAYAIHRGSFTTCDGSTPDWQVTGRDLSVNVGGYGSVTHAALWVKKTPVFYLPYFVFPVKRDRQTGLLAPEAGYSERNGIEWIQPYFWAIHRSLDATLYYHHIQHRGEKGGLEFRYALGPESKATLMFDGMQDRQVDDGRPANRQWGYGDDANLRPNSDRYWFRMKADQNLPWAMKAKLDLDIVSDQDYLREFESGLTGFNHSNAYFEDEFSRDLDDENDPIRENRLNISRLWPRYSFNSGIRWYDDVIVRRRDARDDTLQQLPTMTLDALKQPIPGSPFFFQAASEYTHFYREDGLSGQRLDIHPRFFLPLQIGPWLSFEPAAGIRQTSWLLDSPKGQPGSGTSSDEQRHRQFYDFSAALSTDLFRVYNTASSGSEAIRHTLIPELRYAYVPDHDQSDYPDFDAIDRLEDANRLSLSLTNLLTGKYFRTQGDAPAGRSPEASDARYNRFFRFLLEQSYNFNHWKEPETKPWEPLYAELDLTPRNLLSVHAEAQWSHQDETLRSHLFSGRLYSKRGDRMKIEYRYFKDLRQSINLGVSFPVTPQIRLAAEYERNLDDGADIEKKLECLYESQCWSVAISYADDETDQRLSGMVRLHGLGQIGDRI